MIDSINSETHLKQTLFGQGFYECFTEPFIEL